MAQEKSNSKLAHQFAAYTQWRKALVDTISDYRNWLNEQELNDGQVDQRISQLLERLREDKLNVAFVAEFSRGKSELINAIFFAGYGTRLLPSSAGRTTMCPTELLYDKSKPSSIMLLPIETRLSDATTTEYKRYPDEWKTVTFDVDSNESMVSAFKEVSNTKSVSVLEAERYGLFDPNSSDDALSVNKDGTVDVPSWRYAMINFPHPLLEQGLVILDTPGLNAIGTEPELTLNMLPNAHAVLFILAADTGVTKSEIDVWRQYISGTRWKQKGRLAVLNKIDGLWDELKNEADIQSELTKQIKTSADLLGLETNQIFPISAQKGLLAKVNNDHELLVKSRILELERALSDELIPSKKEIVRDNTQNEIEDLIVNSNLILDARISGINDQLLELRGLRGKNEDVVEHMMNKVKVDKENFEKGLQRFQALRSIFSQHTNRLFTLLGMEALRTHVHTTRETMVDASFTKTIRVAMDNFFSELKKRLVSSDTQIDEIKKMMDVMYEKFSKDHGLRKSDPPAFSTLRYQKELAKLERAYKEQFNTAFNMIANEKMTLTSKFFETLASRVIHVFEVANRDIENWLKAVISPMESQVREHQLQLRRRLESIKRIYKATDTLEDRILELEAIEKSIQAQLDDLKVLRMHMKNALAFEPADNEMAA
ncbi:dynamin family protein [Methylotenera sp.]|uniref:dynamin family protein n=1 Tax=Methylotenera sp. TaxID=2051956 RepID=UPI00272113D2|nr:dynamin family protein [Methylotenera sp.]MDO9206136.1 dynamin family protein [Methylotenera sp.]MDO9393244.1 dynamin family protein [Methylotenera sp.]MDP1522976.1 dynamin family protein [Methylotenera sp.]MDP2070924.1 dynamin family protein [Methylotenera sp.]MDP3005798.1 dynamin family protein [Methylotenera sp.]